MGFFRLLLPSPLAAVFLRAGCAGASDRIVADRPAQVPVVLYKLALVMLAAILGMFFDVAVFPFATPDSYS